MLLGLHSIDWNTLSGALYLHALSLFHQPKAQYNTNIRDVSPTCLGARMARYGQDGPGIVSRCGARFSTPVQTAPGAYPASCTMGTGSFPAVKLPGRGVDHPSPSSVLRSWKGRAIPVLTLWNSVACYRVKLKFEMFVPSVSSSGKI